MKQLPNLFNIWRFIYLAYFLVFVLPSILWGFFMGSIFSAWASKPFEISNIIQSNAYSILIRPTFFILILFCFFKPTLTSMKVSFIALSFFTGFEVIYLIFLIWPKYIFNTPIDALSVLALLETSILPVINLISLFFVLKILLSKKQNV